MSLILINVLGKLFWFIMHVKQTYLLLIIWLVSENSDIQSVVRSFLIWQEKNISKFHLSNSFHSTKIGWTFLFWRLTSYENRNKWIEKLPHPAYSLTQLNYYLFRLMANFLIGRIFKNHVDIKMGCLEFFASKSKVKYLTCIK